MVVMAKVLILLFGMLILVICMALMIYLFFKQMFFTNDDQDPLTPL
jgi:hypothetical protein